MSSSMALLPKFDLFSTTDQLYNVINERQVSYICELFCFLLVFMFKSCLLQEIVEPTYFHPTSGTIVFDIAPSQTMFIDSDIQLEMLFSIRKIVDGEKKDLDRGN